MYIYVYIHLYIHLCVCIFTYTFQNHLQTWNMEWVVSWESQNNKTKKDHGNGGNHEFSKVWCHCIFENSDFHVPKGSRGHPIGVEIMLKDLHEEKRLSVHSCLMSSKKGSPNRLQKENLSSKKKCLFFSRFQTGPTFPTKIAPNSPTPWNDFHPKWLRWHHVPLLPVVGASSHHQQSHALAPESAAIPYGLIGNTVPIPKGPFSSWVTHLKNKKATNFPRGKISGYYNKWDDSNQRFGTEVGDSHKFEPWTQPWRIQATYGMLGWSLMNL